MILGIVLLVAGGALLLRGAVALATLARVTRAVIGLTVVAAGTSVPELAVSLPAALKGSEAVAVGNIVGSNIFNLTFILGLAALIRPLAIGGNTIRIEYLVLALVTLLCVVVCRDGRIGRLDGVRFLGIYVAFTAFLVTLVRRQMNEQEVREFQVEVDELTRAVPPAGKTAGWASVVLVGVGVLLLVGGAHATVTGAIDLGRHWGLSERVIGLTIVAGGTGLPEVVTSLVSSIRGRDDIAIGNVIGSNLFNILGTLGISGLVRPVAVPEGILAGDNYWMLGLTLLLFPVMLTGMRIGRREGASLLAAYGVYLAVLLGRPEAS
ncbi:calcium/sodium antiporter [Paludisphaera soli]|uniref:calcium/sodium antiporter n=1 Tax=Paludisphaera soli TaxID=2712865 RepID=UPI0013EB0AC4|nr:calcium/sodium antiporter [Paludisphaera soli]